MGFQRVVQILDDAVGGPNAGVLRHGPFWRNITRDEFITRKIFGKALVVLGDGAASNLVRALKGEAPFGSDLPDPRRREYSAHAGGPCPRAGRQNRGHRTVDQ
jgi:hypothetical protein